MAAGPLGFPLICNRKERSIDLKTFMTGLLALVGMVMVGLAPAKANDGIMQYQAGSVEAAIAKGDTVLLHYKSTW